MGSLSFSLILGTFLTAFGSSLLYGYNISILNLPEQEVKNYLAKNSSVKEDVKTGLYSLATSIFIVGGAAGAFASGLVADFLGRRLGLLANDGVMIVGASMFLVSHFTKVPELVYVGRAVVGISSGMTLGLASMYLTEIAPVKFRGIIGACHQLAVTLGIAVANVLTFKEVLGGAKTWLIAASLLMAPASIELSVHWILPESPRHLYNAGKLDAAKAANRKYNPDCSDEDFIKEMDTEAAKSLEEPKFQFIKIFSSTYTRAMLIACFIQVLQQLSGINAVMSYSKNMMITAGVEEKVIPYCAFGVSMFNVIVTVVSLPLLERFGRRSLLLWPTVSLAICLVGLGVTVQLVTDPSMAIHVKKGFSIAAIVFIFIYVGSFAVGLGNVPALIVSELFRQGPRGAAYSVSQTVQWLCNLVVTLVYPNVEKTLRGGVFFIFLGFVVGIWLMLFFIMPETKNRTVDEICMIMDGPLVNIYRSAKKTTPSNPAASENPVTENAGGASTDETKEEAVTTSAPSVPVEESKA